ncbi:hypothetical protein Tco_0435524 [Tanacetum coccineum]
MPYDHTPPSIAVPQTFFSHEDRQIKSMAEEGSSATACAHDVHLIELSYNAWQFAADECTWELSQQEYEQLRAIPSVVTHRFCKNVMISSPETCSTQTEVPRIIGASSSIANVPETNICQNSQKANVDTPELGSTQTQVTRHEVLKRTRHGAFRMRKHWPFRRINIIHGTNRRRHGMTENK